MSARCFIRQLNLIIHARGEIPGYLLFLHKYSAFNLEEPLLCFVVNKYVLCSEKVTIIAIGLKFAMSVHTSFCSVCRKSGLIMLVDSKVVAACVPGIGLQLEKNVLRPGK